ncbi:MAG: hypothetical protein OXD47_04385 [Gammaproteobacteria bacterium]|nr:hypothetical protein [Gammaproteobacteria bacterium]MCY4283160.1 hypothetical protein [Gammaproteobacteria bacterium]MCY4338020.1 hypothetical protein [Gammaproteobacteria bacterium]
MAKATHIQIEDKHLVIVNDLHVLVSGSDEKGWFAQGVEIDYSACGETLEDVKKNFSIGFEYTIKEHLKRNGNIESFLRYTPFDELHALLGAEDFDFSNISAVGTSRINKDDDLFLPFDKFCFLRHELRQAA